MGFRPTMVKEYSIEYGSEFVGDYNWGVDKFEEFLCDAGIEYDITLTSFTDTNGFVEIEINIESLFSAKLEGLTEDQIKDIQTMQRTARNAEYAIKDGYLKIHWF
ncbi:Uncharacterised protein [Campylobacter hyointestinalis subsp. hyointestinalis]|uniref:Uncharacterized protein n=1 Tax=Campylobacter hyointestinalis subsp. hyointestinalis TaxID=91352 RepID=A0A0S4SUL6_CAMHY|nr:hypothetical protein [Campylobacter hyointestinalis]CUU89688.1 Uncharacterised protein [Campylobacter hyointestinalis subsp. hyointestinalis]